MNRMMMTTRSRTWLAALLALATTTAGTAANARADEAKESVVAPAPADAARPPEAARRADDESARRAPVDVRASSRPRVITDWQEGETVPPGYHPAQRMRKGAVIGGAVTFGVIYFINVLVAAGGTDYANSNHTSNSVAGLYAPVVGPFITMTQSSSAVADVFLVLDGLAQAGGAVLLLYGLTSPQTVLMRDDVGRPRLLPQPMLFGSGGAGAGLVGTF
jgi:hypothetical protein